MDDLMTGADGVEECSEIKQKIEQHLTKFGFHLRMWLTNNSSILKDNVLQCSEENYIINSDEAVKTLGLKWDPKRDEFKFDIDLKENQKITKRQILSNLATTFDPLGWLSPITIVLKLFVQNLWTQKLTWDEELSMS
ncbi:unnamed protein product [Ceratitis capitata]|uniref:(Mediterranean fruit fly) hypothetical protein n=1 Tax=Ceratitis capitata TaxID=7213 RepID=A0A811UTY7_CERCA|nr:unnamed protein product [Ceratitis capitata]